MGDVDGDTIPEILAASGAGRMAEIRVFKEQVGSTVLRELTAYRTLPFGSAYLGGTEVACGDVDANGREDIVAAMSRGGGTVNIFLSVNAADPIAYSLGFVTATGLLHLAGIGLGLLTRWPAGVTAVRAMGAGIAVGGLGFLFHAW
jgi:hypothetical protein